MVSINENDVTVVGALQRSCAHTAGGVYERLESALLANQLLERSSTPGIKCYVFDELTFLYVKLNSRILTSFYHMTWKQVVLSRTSMHQPAMRRGRRQVLTQRPFAFVRYLRQTVGLSY